MSMTRNCNWSTDAYLPDVGPLRNVGLAVSINLTGPRAPLFGLCETAACTAICPLDRLDILHQSLEPNIIGLRYLFENLSETFLDPTLNLSLDSILNQLRYHY